jgi:hypothetical protein
MKAIDNGGLKTVEGLGLDDAALPRHR